MKVLPPSPSFTVSQFHKLHPLKLHSPINNTLLHKNLPRPRVEDDRVRPLVAERVVVGGAVLFDGAEGESVLVVGVGYEGECGETWEGEEKEEEKEEKKSEKTNERGGKTAGLAS